MRIEEEIGVVESLGDAEEAGASMRLVSVRFADGRVEQASLRPDALPSGLSPGDRVAVTRAALYRRWRIVRA